jgi:6-phosphogluconolactonase
MTHNRIEYACMPDHAEGIGGRAAANEGTTMSDPRVRDGRTLICRVAMANATQTDFVVLNDARTLARCAADWLLNRVLAVGEHAAVCVAGGSTSLGLYRLLATPAYRDRFPWKQVHWFWGDERFVRAGDPRSNCGTIRAILFDHVPVPPENIHAIRHHGSPELAAADYERALKRSYGSEHLGLDRPLFAATVLGVGEDGRTASLRPDSAALEERTRWVTAVSVDGREPCITLTIPALASSGEIAFLLSGGRKREIIARIRRAEAVPATRIRSAGRTRWFMDCAAAGADAE